jgi:hypothetical protein
MRSFASPRVIRSKVVSGCALDGKRGDSSSPKLYITLILTCLPSNGSHIRRVRAHMPYNRNVWQPSAKFLSIARKSGRIIQSSREKRIPSKLVRTYQAWSVCPFLCLAQSLCFSGCRMQHKVLKDCLTSIRYKRISLENPVGHAATVKALPQSTFVLFEA